MEEYSVVGKRLPLKDAADKVTGRALFTGDIKLPGMLYAKILRSPYAHAKILRIDTREAEKLPGVKAVLSRNNTPRVKIPVSFVGTPRDKYLFDEKVRYLGDEVAAVAGINEEVAQKAVDLIKVEYEELPAVFDPKEALKEEAPLIHEDKPGNIAGIVTRMIGDVEAGFGEADYVFEEIYKTSSQRHAAMETHIAIASFDAMGRLTVWSPSQNPFELRGLLAEYLDLPISKVRVMKPYVGGAFGSKLDMLIEHICALLAKVTGHPVKLTLTREEEFSATLSQHSEVIRLKMGVKQDGRFSAIEADVDCNVGAYMYKGMVVLAITGSTLIGVYRCPNVKFEGRCVYTNLMSAGALRGFGNPPAYFALESAVDMVAQRLGIDPVEFRLKNCKGVGEVGRTGMPITSSGLDQCLAIGAEYIGWGRRQKSGASGNMKKNGMGVACGAHGSGTRPALRDYSAAFVKINEDGTVHLLTGAADLGTGSHTTLAQIVAEELDLSLGAVEVVTGDTDVAPFDKGAYASSELYVAGGAVRAAAADAKHQLLSRAAGKLGVEEGTLELKKGIIYAKNAPEKSLKVSELIREASETREGATAFLGKASFENPVSAQTFSAQFAEVEIDTETGQVEVQRIVAVHDVGKAINPMVVEGQIEGGGAAGHRICLDGRTGCRQKDRKNA